MVVFFYRVIFLIINSIKFEVEVICGYFCCQKCVFLNGKGFMGIIFFEFLDIDKLFCGFFIWILSWI